MTALIVFESMFGNTEAVARAVATGVAEHLPVEVVEVAAAPEQIDGYDLVVVGGPTHAFGMTRASTRKAALDQGATGPAGPGVREWLSGLAASGRPAGGGDVRHPRPHARRPGIGGEGDAPASAATRRRHLAGGGHVLGRRDTGPAARRRTGPGRALGRVARDAGRAVDARPRSIRLMATSAPIVVGVDRSDESAVALTWALRWATALGRPLTVVHAVGLLEEGGYRPAPEVAEQVEEAHRAVPGSDPVDVDVVREDGPAVDVLLRVAERLGRRHDRRRPPRPGRGASPPGLRQ